MNKMLRVIIYTILVSILITIFPTKDSSAVERTWDGGGDNNNWSTIDNWGGTAPSPDDSLTFDGTERLSNSNNYTADTHFGLITFSADGFNLSGNSIILDNGILNETGTQTFNINSKLNTSQSFTSDGTMLNVDGTVNNSGYTLTVNGTGDTTISGIISNTGGLTKDGSGELTLSGTNTYTGTTTISAGTLKYGINDALSNSTAVTVADTATFDIGQYDDNTIGSLAGNTGTPYADIAFGSLTTGGDNSSTAFSGVISGSNGNLIKAGSGTFTLSGSNTYTGATTISAGTLKLGKSDALHDSTGVSISSGAVFDMADFSDAIDNLSGEGNITLGWGDLTADGNSSTFSGVISGNGSFTKYRSGTLTLSGTNTYIGDTKVTGGTLTYGAHNVIDNASDVVVNGGNLNLASFNDTVGIVTLTSGSILGSGTLTSTTAFNVASGEIYAELAGAGIGLTKTTSGTVTLKGINTYTGTTTISAGTLKYGINDALSNSTAVTVADAATFDIGQYDDNTIGSLAGNTGTPYADIAFGSLTTGGDNSSTAFSGVISGSNGNLIKAGSGTFTLSGNNTYTGATTISAGTLKLGKSDVLHDSTDVSISSGAVFDMADFSDAIDDLSGEGNITLGWGDLTADGNSSTFSGVISGNGSFTKYRSGTLTLSGTNTYIGDTTISAGTLSVTGSISNSATTINSSGTLAGSGATGSVVIESGGIIAPGTSIGTLNTGAQTWENGGIYLCEVDGVETNDLLNITGAMDISNLDTTFTIKIYGNPALTEETPWVIANFYSLTGSFDADEFTLDNQTGAGGQFSLVYNEAQTRFELSYVPEPSTYAFFAIGLIGLIGTAVRKKKKAAIYEKTNN